MRNGLRDTLNPSHRVRNRFFFRSRENDAEAENAEAEEYFQSLCEWGFDQKEAETKIDKRVGSLDLLVSLFIDFLTHLMIS